MRFSIIAKTQIQLQQILNLLYFQILRHLIHSIRSRDSKYLRCCHVIQSFYIYLYTKIKNLACLKLVNRSLIQFCQMWLLNLITFHTFIFCIFLTMFIFIASLHKFYPLLELANFAHLNLINSLLNKHLYFLCSEMSGLYPIHQKILFLNWTHTSCFSE